LDIGIQLYSYHDPGTINWAIPSCQTLTYNTRKSLTQASNCAAKAFEYSLENRVPLVCLILMYCLRTNIHCYSFFLLRIDLADNLKIPVY